MIKNINSKEDSCFIESMPQWLSLFAPVILIFLLTIIGYFIWYIRQNSSVEVSLIIHSNVKKTMLLNNTLTLDKILIENNKKVNTNDTIAIVESNQKKKYLLSSTSGTFIYEIDSTGVIQLYIISDYYNNSITGITTIKNQKYIKNHQGIIIVFPDGSQKNGSISTCNYHSLLNQNLYFNVTLKNIEPTILIHTPFHCKGIILI
jgi:hypothetical protein